MDNHAPFACSKHLTVIHESPDLLVLDKPSGLLCVPGRGPDKQDCLSARALARWPDALVVHRLDMATSGLVVMARGLAMQRAMSQAFETRQVDKQYVAIADGLLPIADAWQVIDAPLMADWPRRPLQKVDAAGKASVTHWRAIGCLEQHHASWVELAPQTGRTHQLRVHMASIGHPMLGDALYAGDAVAARAPRLLLHAARLAFVHPFTQEPMVFASAAAFPDAFAPMPAIAG